MRSSEGPSRRGGRRLRRPVRGPWRGHRAPGRRRRGRRSCGTQVAALLLGRPAADVLGDPAGLGMVALAAQHVRADQTGAQAQLGQVGGLRLRGHAGGTFGDALDPEAGHVLQLGDLRRQPPGPTVTSRPRRPGVDYSQRGHISPFGVPGRKPERRACKPLERVPRHGGQHHQRLSRMAADLPTPGGRFNDTDRTPWDGAGEPLRPAETARGPGVSRGLSCVSGQGGS